MRSELWRRFCCWLGGRGVIEVPEGTDVRLHFGDHFEFPEYVVLTDVEIRFVRRKVP